MQSAVLRSAVWRQKCCHTGTQLRSLCLAAFCFLLLLPLPLLVASAASFCCFCFLPLLLQGLADG